MGSWFLQGVGIVWLIVNWTINWYNGTFFAWGAKETRHSPWGRVNQYNWLCYAILDLTISILNYSYTAHWNKLVIELILDNLKSNWFKLLYCSLGLVFVIWIGYNFAFTRVCNISETKKQYVFNIILKLQIVNYFVILLQRLCLCLFIPNHNWFVPIEFWIICRTAIIVVIEFQYLFSILVTVQFDLDSSSVNSS